MRTDIAFEVDLDDDERPVGRGDLIAYYHPREVVSDGSLSLGRRRQLLAFWLSDFNALPSAPSLRSSGRVTATVDDLRHALDALDEMEAMIASTTIGTSQQTAA
jgi:hypothetical protein